MAEKFPVGLPGTQILNGENWANNYATEHLVGDSATMIIFDQTRPSGNSDRWVIENYQDGYKIFNMGSNNWASISGNQVLGTPDFDGETCKWWIEYTGDNQDFWIRVPKTGGLVWTIKPPTSQVQSTVFLESLGNTNVAQRFVFAVPP